MTTEQVAALVGVLVYLLMRVIDALLPGGRHFKFTDRWFSKDEDEDEGKDVLD